MSHSPGPWSWSYSDKECTRPIALTNATDDVILLSDDYDGPRYYISEADQALIVAAPALLKIVAELADCYKRGEGDIYDIGEAAAELIAKIRGKNQ